MNWKLNVMMLGQPTAGAMMICHAHLLLLLLVVQHQLNVYFSVCISSIPYSEASWVNKHKPDTTAQSQSSGLKIYVTRGNK